MGQSGPLFVQFRPFLITISIIQIEKSIGGVLGIQTWGRWMVGADKTTELWRPPFHICYARDKTHPRGKHLGIASLLFDWFGFCNFKRATYFLVQ